MLLNNHLCPLHLKPKQKHTELWTGNNTTTRKHYIEKKKKNTIIQKPRDNLELAPTSDLAN